MILGFMRRFNLKGRGRLILDVNSVYDVRDNIGLRLICVCAVGYYGGISLGQFATVNFFLERVTQDMGVAEYLATVVVGIPVFILLWYFRTRDVRQQIEKTQAQLWQNHFNNAIENLTSDSFLKEEIGIKSLIKLSETTTEFNELIIIAFESSLNKYHRYRSEQKNRESMMGINIEISYARDMLAACVYDWLSRHKNSKEERDDKSLR